MALPLTRKYGEKVRIKDTDGMVYNVKFIGATLTGINYYMVEKTGKVFIDPLVV